MSIIFIGYTWEIENANFQRYIKKKLFFFFGSEEIKYINGTNIVLDRVR